MGVARYDYRWNYWLATGILLGLGLLGWDQGTLAAVALTAVQVAHVAWRERDLAGMPVQVRLLYLAGLLAGLWQPLALLHNVQLAGVWANVLFDYCLAARLLSLMPWNRRVPLTAGLVAWTFLSPPAAGSILDRVPQRGAAATPPSRRRFAAHG